MDKVMNFDLTIARLLRIAHRFWFVIVAGLILGAAGGAVYSQVVTPLYRSSLRFFTWNQTVADAAREITGAIQKDGDKTQAVILYNNLISQSMIIGQSLVNDYKQLLENPSVSQQVKTRLAKEGFRDYKIKISANRQSCIITLEAVSPSPEAAEAAVNTTMEVFQEEQERLMGVRFAQLIQPGNLPESPFFPDLKRVMALGTLLGLLLGIAVATLWDFLDFSVRTPQTIEELDLLFLGELSVQKNLEESLDLEAMEKNRGNRLPDEMMMVKTNLRHRNIENPQRTILVTSDSANYGKSTFSILLAQALAADGKILLVDCDLRKPTLCRKLQQFPPRGLVDCLLGLSEGKPPEEFIVPTKFHHVDFMSHGQYPRRPTDFFESRQFSELLETLGKTYKHIILDSPPVRGMADSFIIAQKVDGVILLVKYAHTRIDHFQRLVSDWHELKSKILGVVINQKKSELSGYGYYSSAGYGENAHGEAK